jgi:hypothetical protein
MKTELACGRQFIQHVLACQTPSRRSASSADEETAVCGESGVHLMPMFELARWAGNIYTGIAISSPDTPESQQREGLISLSVW